MLDALHGIWRVVLVQRTPPLRAAAKRRKRVGQAGADGREVRSLRSPKGRLTAEPALVRPLGVLGGSVEKERPVGIAVAGVLDI